ncbi:MAG: hypothetical protein NTV13_02190 [Actinobacteria bacterium]|nr:hypothetical protein [Actinomycetota bacterium]
MNPLSLASSIVRRMQNTLRGMQQQAPGARMVGEFAVRQAVKEATKTVHNFQSGRTSSTDNEQGPDVKH